MQRTGGPTAPVPAASHKLRDKGARLRPPRLREVALHVLALLIPPIAAILQQGMARRGAKPVL